MSNYYSLNSGELTGANVFGRAIPTGSYYTATLLAPLGTTDSYTSEIPGSNITLSAIAINVAQRTNIPTGSLILSLSSSKTGIKTLNYPVNAFTEYNAQNNLLSAVSFNYQTLKLDAPYYFASDDKLKISLKTQYIGQLDIYGQADITNYMSGSILVANTSRTTNFIEEGGTYSSTITPYSQAGVSFNFSSARGLTVPHLTEANHTATINGIKTAYLGRDDFTIECWFNLRSNPAAGYSPLLSDGPGHNAGWGTIWCLYLINTSATKAIRFVTYHGLEAIVEFPYIAPLNTWTHVAVTRSHNITTIWINGAPLGRSIIDVNCTYNPGIPGPDKMHVGYFVANNAWQWLDGYIADARFVRNKAIYTNNFTRPTAPLTAVSNLSAGMKYYKDYRSPVVVDFTSPFNNTVTEKALIFNGSTDCLTYNHPTNFTFGIEDFTIEFWAYVIDGSGSLRPWICTDNTAPGTGLWIGYDSNRIVWLAGTTTGYYFQNIIPGNGGAIINNQWMHIAYVRKNGIFYIYKNGVMVESVSTYNTHVVNSATGALFVGARPGVGQLSNGIMSNVRIIKGYAAYPDGTTFSVPTSPPTLSLNGTNCLLLTAPYAPFKDNTAAATNIKESPFTDSNEDCIQFFGDNTTIELPYTSNLEIGTRDFCVEAWIKVNSKGSPTPTVFRNNSANTAGNMLSLWIDASGIAGQKFTIVLHGGSNLSSSASITYGEWTHFAINRRSGIMRLYINGAIDTVFSYGNDITSDRPWYLGAPGSSANKSQYFFDGSISNFRVVVGDAVYAQPFTLEPPISPRTPLTRIANTEILTQTPHPSFPAPNITTSTDSPYGAGVDGSLYFAGDINHRIEIPWRSSLMRLGTSDFTIECWVKPVAKLQPYPVILRTCPANPCPSDIVIWATHSNAGADAGKYWVSIAGGLFISSIGNVTYNVWTHIALVREKGILKLYRNGIKQSESEYTSDIVVDQSWYLGVDPNYGEFAYNGYISNFRVINGLCQYPDSGAIVGDTVFTPDTTTPLSCIENVNSFVIQAPYNTQAKATEYTEFLLQLKPKEFNRALISTLPLGNDDNIEETPVTILNANIESPTAAAELSPFGDGDYLAFDGTSHYIDTNKTINVTGNNFTIEAWVLYDGSITAARRDIVNNYSSITAGWELAIDPNGKLIWVSGDTIVIQGTTVLQPNTWYHVAVVGNSGTSLFLDSVQEGTTYTGATAYTSTATVKIGKLISGVTSYYRFSGKISNLRIVNGTALYSVPFSKPTSALSFVTGTQLLIHKPNSILFPASSVPATVDTLTPFPGVDGSLAINIGGKSNGSTGHAQIQASPDNVLLGAFTIELWMYMSTRLGVPHLLSTGNGDTTQNIGNIRIVILPVTDTTSNILIYDGTTILLSSNENNITPINTWHHIAVTRDNNNVWSIYIDGFKRATSPTTFTSSRAVFRGDMPLDIGGQLTSSAIGDKFRGGYISNVRIINGSTVYNGNSFTVPIAPLPVTANTTALVQAPYFISSSPIANVPNTGSAIARYTPSSGRYFSRTNSSIKIPETPLLGLGASDFTIECWIFPTPTTNNYSTIFELGAWDAKGIMFRMNAPTSNNDNLYIGFTPGGTSYQWVSNGTPALNKWSHVALCRIGSTVTVYVNGASTLSVNVGSLNFGSSLPLTIGSNKESTYGFEGYIADFRVIVGRGIYPSTVIPSAPLSVTSDTVLLYNNGSTYQTATTLGDINIGGAIIPNVGTEVCAVTANSRGLKNLYIHNAGRLQFPYTRSTTLEISGTAGLHITSGGILETIGSDVSNNVTPTSTTHTITLSNTQLDVHAGGQLIISGTPKVYTAYLSADTAAGTTQFTTTSNISATWNANDVIAFIPNTSNRTSNELLTLSTCPASSMFTTTVASTYSHPSLTSISYIPTVANLTRNVTIRGKTATDRGTIRANKGAALTIQNTQFIYTGIDSSNKNATIIINPQNYGGIYLDSCAFRSESNSPVLPHISILSDSYASEPLGFISNNIFYGARSNSIRASYNNLNGFIVSKNFIISPNDVGVQYDWCSSTDDVLDNTVIGSPTYGTSMKGCTAYQFNGGIYYNNTTAGLHLSGNTWYRYPNELSAFNMLASYSNIGVIYIDPSNVNYCINIQGLTAINNFSTGIQAQIAGRVAYPVNGTNITWTHTDNSFNISNSVLSGNAIYGANISFISNDRLLYPNYVNLANNTIISNSVGIQANNIAGTISGNRLFNTSKDFNISIGNGTTFFDSNSTTITRSTNFVYITAGLSYCPISINNTTIANNFRLLSGGYTVCLYGGPVIVPDLDIAPAVLMASTWTGREECLNFWYERDDVTHVKIPVNVQFQGFNGFTGSGNYLQVFINDKNTGTYLQNTFGAYQDLIFPVSRISTLGRKANVFSIRHRVIGGLTQVEARVKNVSYSKDNGSTYTKFLSSELYYDDTLQYTPQSPMGVAGILDTSSDAIVFNATNFKYFRMQNTYNPQAATIGMLPATGPILGTYLFNEKFIYIDSAAVRSTYQSSVEKSGGFSNAVYPAAAAFFVSGIIESDPTSSIVNEQQNAPSEILSPSTTYRNKLKSGKKYVAVNQGETASVYTFIKRSSDYNGSNPRLMVSKNSTLGILADTELSKQTSRDGNWQIVKGTTSAALKDGVFEFYIDCDGTVGSIAIDRWAAPTGNL